MHTHEDRKQFYVEHYELLVQLDVLSEDSKPTTIGSREPRRCRLCERSTPEASFRTKAHVVPEFMGCRRLLTYEECDDCNQDFSVHEGHLAKSIAPLRTMHGIPGRKGVPKFSPPGTPTSVWQHAPGDLRGEGKIEDRNLQFDPVHGTGVVRLTTEPFRRLDAYKALVKIAYSILPQEELRTFEKTREWLLDAPSVGAPPGTFPVARAILGKYLPGAHLALVRRKTGHKTPYMIFSLSIWNLAYRLFLPFSAREVARGEQVTFPILPGSVDGLLDVRYEVLDYSSADLSTEVVEISFTSEGGHSVQKIPVPSGEE